MRILKTPKLPEYKFTCKKCTAEFAADIRDYKDTFYKTCSVPTNTGIPKHIIEQHTKTHFITIVQCPICGEEIDVNKNEGYIEQTTMQSGTIVESKN